MAAHQAVRVKVCGLTRVDEALATAGAGVDWIGLNFHRPSPRCVEPGTAAAIVTALAETPARAVGLFVDRPVEEVAATARQVGLRIVQLHGEEPPEAVAALGRSGLTVVKAFRLADTAALERMNAYLTTCRRQGHEPDAVLVDAFVAGVPGGTGQMIPAELLAGLPRALALILAGGLNPGNVAERIAQVRPWMVDVAGGVESAPGRKDPRQVAAFVQAARGV